MLDAKSPVAQPARDWVGLTDDEIIQCVPHWGGTLEDAARAVEAKLKEKNAAAHTTPAHDCEKSLLEEPPLVKWAKEQLKPAQQPVAMLFGSLPVYDPITSEQPIPEKRQ